MNLRQNKWIRRTAVLLISTTGVIAATTETPPAKSSNPVLNSPLAMKAQNDFDSGNFSAALPVFEEIAQKNSDNPDVLGPVQEKIRVCQANLAQPATQPSAGGSTPTTRVPHPTPKDGETLDLAIKDLGNFDYDADHGGNIPADVKALSGHDIKLHGFMIPMDQAANITQFALVPSLFACCFGQPPQLQHTIVVTVPKGKAINYFPDEISVDGTLTVDEKKDDGFIVSIFQVEAKSVKPLAK